MKLLQMPAILLSHLLPPWIRRLVMEVRGGRNNVHVEPVEGVHARCGEVGVFFVTWDALLRMVYDEKILTKLQPLMKQLDLQQVIVVVGRFGMTAEEAAGPLELPPERVRRVISGPMASLQSHMGVKVMLGLPERLLVEILIKTLAKANDGRNDPPREAPR